MYNLPHILSSGPVIHIENALANDSLRIRLTSGITGKYFIAVHNYLQLYYYIPVVTNAAGRSVLINLHDLPKGLETITILDSLHRPCCERLFFAHFDKRPSVTIATDQEIYDKRQLVHLKLRLNGNSSDTTHGLVSIACVQRGRIESMKAKNIDSYVYLENELANLPAYREPIKLITDQKPFLEKLLLVKGWRKYTWQEMADSKAADTAQALKKLSFTGDVTINNKPLKKPINFLVWAGASTTPVSTTADGHFTLSEDQLLIEQGKKIGLFLPDRTRNYSVSFAADFSNIEAALAKRLQPADYQDMRTGVGDDDDYVLAGFEHNIHLKEVVITARRNNEDIPGKNACGDYVCRYGILNCPNHPNDADNVQPKAHQSYWTHSGDVNSNTTMVTRSLVINGAEFHQVMYIGCRVPSNDPLTAIEGISYAKEFYPADYSQPAGSAPDYVSTIFWKGLCLLSPGKDTDLTFYTSDSTGPFRIVMQGITNDDFISVEKDFIVKNKATFK